MGQLVLSATIDRCLLETTPSVGKSLRNKNCLTARNSIYSGIFCQLEQVPFSVAHEGPERQPITQVPEILHLCILSQLWQRCLDKVMGLYQAPRVQGNRI